MTASKHHISVIIPTCNRPDDIRRCLDSLTKVDYPRWDVLVIDQSDDEKTQAIAKEYSLLLPQLSYQHISKKGAAHARNVGLQAVTGDIVALFDDDCTVESCWLVQVADAFHRHPNAVLIIGTVVAAPYDTSRFYIPVFAVPRERVLRGSWALQNVAGMSASFYLRRSMSQFVGPFDEVLGPGGRVFRNSEDQDYCYRCLTAGYSVVQTPAITVRHFGARAYSDGGVSRLIREGTYSLGAADMKLLRCGELAAIIVIARHLVDNLAQFDLRNLLLRRGPSGLAYIAMYLRGLYASFRFDVDRRHRLYVDRQRRGG